MTPSSFIYCNICGAANQAQARLCWACGQPLDASVEDSTPTSSTFAPPAQQPAPATSAEAPASPALLAGRYRIIGIVGKGGFGAVYKAQDRRRNDSLVAIKSINLRHLSPEQIIEATDTFNREVRLLTGLEHPNLPRIYDYFTDPEHWYLVMDFIEGETLAEYLDHSRQGYLPVEEVLALGMQLCTVLGYLHTRQPPIIFRDVKPANVMRAATGHLYLIDFGIARCFTPGQARDTMPLGSPGYAAPEQYGRAQTTAQSDIYSLGATLRTLLTGKDPLEPISGSGPAYPQGQVVPVALDLLLAQMLDTYASQRPASMEVVKRTLQQIRDAHLLYTYRGHSNWVHAVAWSPDGRRIASASFDVQVWDAADGSHVFTYRGHSGRVTTVAWSPDGRRIASGSHDQTVQVWDAADGSHVFTYRGHSDWVHAVAWSPDGRRIASGSRDGAVQVWNAADGSHVFTYRGHSGRVTTVAWSPDERRIVSAGSIVDQTVQVWDAADGGQVFTYRGHSVDVNVVAWSPDGRRIASGSDDKTVQVWDAADGSQVFTYRGHSVGVFAVAWSPNGKRIASSSWDNTVQVWDATDGGHAFTYRGHSGFVYAVVWSPDGKRIASGSDDKTVQVWKAP